jgi:hypothetical protein
LRLEQVQRERRAEMAEQGEHHKAFWFVKAEDCKEHNYPGTELTQWVFKNDYWKSRHHPGFGKLNLPQLW